MTTFLIAFFFILYGLKWASPYGLPGVRPVVRMSLQDNGRCDEILGWGRENQNLFLKKYWQRRPLMIRNAFNEGTLEDKIPSRRELLDLSVDDDVESRLLQFNEEKESWKKTSGPFERSFLSSLKKEDIWTILVQEVDRHVPVVADMWEHFDFIPGWRRDDVMISYATAGGGIGAHVDNYDVFLIQGRGEREWSIENTFLSNSDELAREVKGAQTRLLTGFEADHSWRLKPGDMLYLPPRIPHRGVSCGQDCTTVSMGFRAPSYRSMMVAFSAHLCSTSIDENHYFSDPLLWQHGTEEHDEEGGGNVARRAREDISATLSQHFLKGLADRRIFDLWLGRYLTEPLRMHIRPPRAFFLLDGDGNEDADADTEEGEEEEEEFSWGDSYDDEDDELPLAVSSRHAVASQRQFPDTESVLRFALAPHGNRNSPAPVDLRLFEGVRRAYIPAVDTLFVAGEPFPVPRGSESIARLLGSSPTRTLDTAALREAFASAEGAMDEAGQPRKSAAFRFLCGLIRSGYYYPVEREGNGNDEE